ncbi:hypothetical protein BGZ46_004852, partial [Entomortierella lignicola]
PVTTYECTGERNCRRLLITFEHIRKMTFGLNVISKYFNVIWKCLNKDWKSALELPQMMLEWLYRENESTTAQNVMHSHYSRPRCPGSPSPIPASSIPPGAAHDTGHTIVDSSESEDESQPVKWPPAYEGTPKRIGTDHQNPFLSTPEKRQVDAEDIEFPDLETDLTCLKILNQDVTWVCNGIDIVNKFHEFKLTNSQSFSFALDGIADLTPGSRFEMTLPRHIQSDIYRSEIKPIDVNKKWPTINHGEIETRSLEVLITGVEERKNLDRDLRFEIKQIGQFADGVGLHGASQIYLAEASTLRQPKAQKLQEDEFKLVRAMRDSWLSQLKATCRESIPCRAMTVFGSSSNKDETKLWQKDFKGVLRLFQIDSFLIPQKKLDFGRKMKVAALSCIKLAARVQMELQKRESEAIPATYLKRIELNKAIRGIQATTPTPDKPRKRFK